MILKWHGCKVDETSYMFKFCMNVYSPLQDNLVNAHFISILLEKSYAKTFWGLLTFIVPIEFTISCWIYMQRENVTKVTLESDLPTILRIKNNLIKNDDTARCVGMPVCKNAAHYFRNLNWGTFSFCREVRAAAVLLCTVVHSGGFQLQKN